MVASEATQAVQQQAAAPVQDTTGLAQFQSWKAMNELTPVTEYGHQQIATAPVKAVRKSIAAPARKSAPAPSAPQTKAPANNNTEADANDGAVAGTGNSESAGEAKAEKKGMSKAVKGAIIGGAGGAVAGAVINKKNRVAGAVIGGVIGAGGGYVIGKKKWTRKTQEKQPVEHPLYLMFPIFSTEVFNTFTNIHLNPTLKGSTFVGPFFGEWYFGRRPRVAGALGACARASAPEHGGTSIGEGAIVNSQ